MGKIIKDTIHANGIDIGIYTQDFENEFISLTDIARYKSDDPTAVIQNWMRNRDVIEFLGLWERLHNPDFKPLEFEGVKKQAGANAFTMSPKKWIEATNAIGIVSKAGRYGGTYAHSDIAMSFATWISPEFQLYIMKDYRRLKTDENSLLSLEAFERDDDNGIDFIADEAVNVAETVVHRMMLDSISNNIGNRHSPTVIIAGYYGKGTNKGKFADTYTNKEL